LTELRREIGESKSMNPDPAPETTGKFTREKKKKDKKQPTRLQQPKRRKVEKGVPKSGQRRPKVSIGFGFVGISKSQGSEG